MIFETSNDCFHLFFQLCNGRFLFLDFAVRLQKFVEQHCVHRVVADGVNLALLIAHYQVWIHSGHFLGYQTKLRRASAIALVMKRYGFKTQDSFAGLIHRCNLFLKPARRADRAELTVRVDHDWYGVGICRCNVTNAADKAAVAHVCTSGADSNNVIGGGNAAAGFKPQSRVVVAGGVGMSVPKPMAVLASPVVLLESA